MRILNTMVCAGVLTVSSVISAYAEIEEKFKCKHVLEWNAPQQNTYFQNSIAMVSIVASQNVKAKAECIADWYFKDDKARHAANNELRDYFHEYPESHPGAIVLAYVIKNCGSMTFTK